MIGLFLKLLTAHLLGDFVFQPRKWVEKRHTRIFYLLIHIGVHVILLSLVFLPDPIDKWQVILFVASSHLAIDSLKIWLEKKRNKRSICAFIVDQFLHIAVLVAVVFYEYGWPQTLLSELNYNKLMLYVIALLMTIFVTPTMLRLFFNKWEAENKFYNKESTTLMDAGMIIGILERLIIVLFIQVGFLAGIGFLLAAKSIFRFGDLTNAKDTKFTEYVLVGTLASFMLGIGIGYLLLITSFYV